MKFAAKLWLSAKYASLAFGYLVWALGWLLVLTADGLASWKEKLFGLVIVNVGTFLWCAAVKGIYNWGLWLVREEA